MKKITLPILVCLVALLTLTTGCEERYSENDANKDMVEYLNNKYKKTFEVKITETFPCSGGIGTCEYRGEAYIKGDSSKKCTVSHNHQNFSDDCDTLFN